ncbi:MAG: glycosyltransferase family 2 protein [Deltaproteobacteria bacterium]
MNPPAQPKVAIVIVTWNKRDFVLSLLGSLKDLNYENFDTLVVDNASTDGTAESIRAEFPAVELIVNPKNLGGTGGFNTGMRRAVEKGGYEFIWLLDNDASVEKETLAALVQSMRSDPKAGIIGSMIMEADRESIVELGAFIEWNAGTWRANLRNEKARDLKLQDAVEVDYVAACSALVRTEVIRKIGVMDERYFIHWDDIDLSLRAKAAGYRIKASPASRAYHGIEDKPASLLMFYYDIRNGLLTVSKHHSGIRSFIYILKILRNAGKGWVYSHLVGLNDTARLIGRGVRDFINGNFYKANISPASASAAGGGLSIEDLGLKAESSALILPNGKLAEIKRVAELIKSGNPNRRITLLIQSERQNLFRDLGVDFIVFNNYRQSTMSTISALAKILAGGFDVCISPGPEPLPFSHASSKYFLFDAKSGKFTESPETLKNCWKLAVSLIAGEALGWLSAPAVYLASRRSGIRGR